jgi:steroid 5-alpha reductase family enzyme
MTGKVSRAASFLCILAVYLAALGAAVPVYFGLCVSPVLLRAFAADAAAALVVWLAGVLLGNSSVYDSYWSVAPVALAVLWVAADSLNIKNVLFLAVLLVWGIRLTLNWARRWRGLGHEDWRYAQYRAATPRLWPAVNLFGIHLMPTILVFLGMVPVCKGMAAQAPANLFTAAGCALCAAAILIEHMADRQLDAYRARPQPKSPYIAEGVWLWCRHPNYLGEVLFWWGIWAMQMSVAPLLRTIIGPACITLLFIFVSIPMMERHMLKTRPEYAEYMRKVPMLLPLPQSLSAWFDARRRFTRRKAPRRNG